VPFGACGAAIVQILSKRKDPLTKTETFAEQHRLKVTRDECNDQVIQGRRGHLYKALGPVLPISFSFPVRLMVHFSRAPLGDFFRNAKEPGEPAFFRCKDLWDSVLPQPRPNVARNLSAQTFGQPLSVSIETPRCFRLRQRLRGARLLSLLGFRGSRRFLDRRFCSLSLLALAFQAQFGEILLELAVVHDSSLQREELSLLHVLGFYWASAKPQKVLGSDCHSAQIGSQPFPPVTVPPTKKIDRCSSRSR